MRLPPSEAVLAEAAVDDVVDEGPARVGVDGDRPCPDPLHLAAEEFAAEQSVEGERGRVVESLLEGLGKWGI